MTYFTSILVHSYAINLQGTPSFPLSSFSLTDIHLHFVHLVLFMINFIHTKDNIALQSLLIFNLKKHVFFFSLLFSFFLICLVCFSNPSLSQYPSPYRQAFSLFAWILMGCALTTLFHMTIMLYFDY